MKLVLILAAALLAAGCCSVPCDYVAASAAFERSALARYRAYLVADPELSDAFETLYLSELEARRLATEEALRICEECGQ